MKYRDLYDVVNVMVDRIRDKHTRDQLARLLKPNAKNDFAPGWFSKLTRRGYNVGITLEELDHLLDLTEEGAQVLADYLVQRHGASIPAREITIGKHRATLHLKKEKKA